MCLPTKLLKCVVEFNAWIVTLLGVAAIITGIVIGAKTAGSAASFFSDTFSQAAIVDIYYIFGAGLLLFGIFGIVGGKKRNAFCLFIFNIFVVVMFFAFGILGITGVVLTDQLGPSTQESCATSKWSSTVNDAVYTTESLFCSSACPCLVSQQNKYLNTNSTLVYTFNRSETSFTELNQCPNVSLTPEQITYYQTMKSAENLFSCSGWCYPYGVMEFSNSLDNPNGQTCFTEVNNFLHQYGKASGITALVISGFMLLTILFSFCLCCHPEQKNQAHSNYYQRMAYYDA